MPDKKRGRKSIYLSFSPATPAKCKLAICKGERREKAVILPGWVIQTPKKLFKRQHHSNSYLLISSNLNFLAAGASQGDSSTRAVQLDFTFSAQCNFLMEKNIYGLLPTGTKSQQREP